MLRRARTSVAKRLRNGDSGSPVYPRSTRSAAAARGPTHVRLLSNRTQYDLGRRARARSAKLLKGRACGSHLPRVHGMLGDMLWRHVGAAESPRVPTRFRHSVRGVRRIVYCVHSNVKVRLPGSGLARVVLFMKKHQDSTIVCVRSARPGIVQVLDRAKTKPQVQTRTSRDTQPTTTRRVEVKNTCKHGVKSHVTAVLHALCLATAPGSVTNDLGTVQRSTT